MSEWVYARGIKYLANNLGELIKQVEPNLQAMPFAFSILNHKEWIWTNLKIDAKGSLIEITWSCIGDYTLHLSLLEFHEFLSVMRILDYEIDEAENNSFSTYPRKLSPCSCEIGLS